MEENKSTQPTPDQLIKALELQMEAARSLRKPQHSKQKTVLWASAVVIIMVAFGVLWAMLMFLEEIKNSKPKHNPVSAEQRN